MTKTKRYIDSEYFWSQFEALDITEVSDVVELLSRTPYIEIHYFDPPVVPIGNMYDEMAEKIRKELS